MQNNVWKQHKSKTVKNKKCPNTWTPGINTNAKYKYNYTNTKTKYLDTRETKEPDRDWWELTKLLAGEKTQSTLHWTGMQLKNWEKVRVQYLLTRLHLGSYLQAPSPPPQQDLSWPVIIAIVLLFCLWNVSKAIECEKPFNQLMTWIMYSLVRLVRPNTEEPIFPAVYGSI